MPDHSQTIFLRTVDDEQKRTRDVSGTQIDMPLAPRMSPPPHMEFQSYVPTPFRDIQSQLVRTPNLQHHQLPRFSCPLDVVRTVLGIPSAIAPDEAIHERMSGF